VPSSGPTPRATCSGIAVICPLGGAASVPISVTAVVLNVIADVLGYYTG
jgi:hypothetical protein